MSRTLADRSTSEKRAMLQRIGTPQALFNYLDSQRLFSIDICAEPWSAKLPRYLTKEQDAFKVGWEGERAFCNPPYEDIGPWVTQAIIHARQGRTVTTLLVPVRTDREWFWRNTHSMHVTFLRGRYKMQKPPDWTGKWSSGGFPLMVLDIYKGACGFRVDTIHPKEVEERYGREPEESL